MTATVPVRVTVLDTWDEIALEAAPDATVADLKRQALSRAGVTRSPDEYLVKYHGAEVADANTVTRAAIEPNAALIVLSRRRTPVR